jgi:hypothetical protein
MRFDRKDWFRLPLELRRRWWRETNYGTRAAPQELVELLTEEISRINKETEND